MVHTSYIYNTKHMLYILDFVLLSQSWLKPMIYTDTTQNITSINIQYFFIILCIRPYLKIMQHIFVIGKIEVDDVEQVAR